MNIKRLKRIPLQKEHFASSHTLLCKKKLTWSCIELMYEKKFRNPTLKV